MIFLNHFRDFWAIYGYSHHRCQIAFVLLVIQILKLGFLDNWLLWGVVTSVKSNVLLFACYRN